MQSLRGESMTKEKLDKANAMHKEMDDINKTINDLLEYEGWEWSLYADCGDGVKDYVATVSQSIVDSIVESLRKKYEEVKNQFESL